MKPIIIGVVSLLGLLSCASHSGIDPVIPYSAYPRAAEIRRLLKREEPPICGDRRFPGVEIEGCVDTLDSWNNRRAALEAELARFVPWGETAEEHQTAAVSP